MLVQALTAQGLSTAEAKAYQAYIDAGVVVVSLGVVGGQAVYRFAVNSAKVSAADRTALAALEQKSVGGGVANSVSNTLPENPSQLGHIFRDSAGHLLDTAENRQLLSNTTNNTSNLAGIDRFGNNVYISTQADGSQVWGYTRNGTIQNGGVNNPPKVWISGYGLK